MPFLGTFVSNFRYCLFALWFVSVNSAISLSNTYSRRRFLFGKDCEFIFFTDSYMIIFMRNVE
jgi:hypothetical protein